MELLGLELLPKWDGQHCRCRLNMQYPMVPVPAYVLNPWLPGCSNLTILFYPAFLQLRKKAEQGREVSRKTTICVICEADYNASKLENAKPFQCCGFNNQVEDNKDEMRNAYGGKGRTKEEFGVGKREKRLCDQTKNRC